MTNGIRRRVLEHKLKLTPSFAALCNITRLVYFESFEDVRKAIEREKQIKAWTPRPADCFARIDESQSG
ncbi:MAG TPA: hypothetical protein VMU26_15800 [Candidatus Polarisedimenticolia bacterium]|nr:hypothetical protein [Candidatus Polarisedimenticolia bacterium]